MFPVSSYLGICQRLGRGCSSENTMGRVRMVGLLFAPFGIEITDKEILMRIPYYHERSGKNTDFFCAGYLNEEEASSEQDRYADIKSVDISVSGEKWYYSDIAFNGLRQDIEQRTTWKYSGAADLILLNAGFGSLDFSSAIVVNLSEAKRLGAIVSVGEFFEDIFRYAEHQNGFDPTWGFSDMAGMKVARSGLKRLVLSLMPKQLGKEFQRAAEFVVTDIRQIV